MGQREEISWDNEGTQKRQNRRTENKVVYFLNSNKRKENVKYELIIKIHKDTITA